MYKRIAAKYINAILSIDNDGFVQPINVHYTKLLQIYNYSIHDLLMRRAYNNIKIIDWNTCNDHLMVCIDRYSTILRATHIVFTDASTCVLACFQEVHLFVTGSEHQND